MTASGKVVRIIKAIKAEGDERCSVCLYGDKCRACGICGFFVPIDDNLSYFEEDKEAEFREYYRDYIEYVSDFN